MADRKDRMALLNRFNKYYSNRYKAKPTYNLWAEQWAADALVDSYGLDYCYDLLEYYFESAQNPDWKYFSNFAHDIIASRESYFLDIKERKERREKAKKWLSE